MRYLPGVTTVDDEMVGAEYLFAAAAAVTLGYALPTRHLLAAGMVEARDPVPTHPLMLLRGPDVIRDVALWPPEQARVVIVLGGVGVFLLKFRYQSGVRLKYLIR